MSFIGVLITGGVTTPNYIKVELYDLSTRASCTLPDLPEPRFAHSSHDGILCGGGVFSPTSTVCKKLINGVWTITHNLSTARTFHCSWENDPGVSFMLLGGVNAQSGAIRTTDVVFYNGTVQTGFELAYDARYEFLRSNFIY